jgi:hypothetical protein
VSAVWGGATIITPSEDSIGNIEIVTNDYDAEDGRFAGAMTKITSKSGSNNIHGSLFAEINRPGLNAYQRWNGPQSSAPCTSAANCTPSARGLLRDTDRLQPVRRQCGRPDLEKQIFAFFNYEGQNDNRLGRALDGLRPRAGGAGALGQHRLQDFGFAGGNVLGTVITTATCSTANIPSAYCQNVSGGLNIGSPLTSGLGKQDLGPT